MAESLDSNASTSARSDDGESEEQPKKPDTMTTNDTQLECPVCLQTCVHPVRLPCGHIFCFLCVKGVAFKNLRCALCRCDIPLTYLDHPQLVNGVEEIERAATSSSETNQYQWYYEGRNGWWQYDERTSQELEEAYASFEKSCKILVAGFVYIVNFEHKCQIRQNDYSRIRRVKRDLVTIPKKGVAGLRLETVATQPPISTSDVHELSSALMEMNLNEGASTSAAAETMPSQVRDSAVDEIVETADNISQPEGENTGIAEPDELNLHTTDTSFSINSSTSSSSDDDEDERLSDRDNLRPEQGHNLIDLSRPAYANEAEDEDGRDDENLLIL
ncbi:E3 ubiquitin-protein ligase rnf146 [Anopheles cruzii]|uniref:E3 ubiquitin-protein ligase rnf146 n=1 Tax=Anopheles cruzii TaxID=68878 RepID=UPI0022EC5FB3|nr:E3 ubiquitin-protein ligase rnf146 [Anopheles cruzii]